MRARLRRWTAVRPTPLHLVLLVWCLGLVAFAIAGPGPTTRPTAAHPAAHRATRAAATATRVGPHGSVSSGLPGGRRHVFAGHVLVAYYGTAGTGSLGVLGEASPDAIWPRLVRAGHPFARPGRAVQPVFELIVSVAQGSPGRDHDYSADIPRSAVQSYIDAAHRHGALLLLDLQTGRTDFLTVAKRWAWALRDPWVGLAVDPEWRMEPHAVPGRRVGHVGAGEVNRVSGWLEHFTVAHALPEKVFMLHQFRTDMVHGIDRIVRRPHLAMVQHVDGFGTPGQKLATYHAVVRPKLFHEGFKLFYDEDVHRMSAARVLRIRPRVSFVSFQ